MAKKSFKVLRSGGVGIGSEFFGYGAHHDVELSGADLEWFGKLKKSGELVEDSAENTPTVDTTQIDAANEKIKSLGEQLTTANTMLNAANEKIKSLGEQLTKERAAATANATKETAAAGRKGATKAADTPAPEGDKPADSATPAGGLPGVTAI